MVLKTGLALFPENGTASNLSTTKEIPLYVGKFSDGTFDLGEGDKSAIIECVLDGEQGIATNGVEIRCMMTVRNI